MPSLVLATFLDPYTMPPVATLPIGWGSEFREPLWKPNKDFEPESAVGNLKELPLRRE